MPAHSAGANSIFIESSVSDFVAEVTVGAVVCVVLWGDRKFPRVWQANIVLQCWASSSRML